MPLKNCLTSHKGFQADEISYFEKEKQKLIDSGMSEKQAEAKVISIAIDEVTNNMSSVYQQIGISADKVDNAVLMSAQDVVGRIKNLDPLRARAIIKAYTNATEEDMDGILPIQVQPQQQSAAPQEQKMEVPSSQEITQADVENFLNTTENLDVPQGTLDKLNSAMAIEDVAERGRALMQVIQEAMQGSMENMKSNLGTKLYNFITFQTSQNDTQDNNGISSTQQQGQESVQAQPIEGRSQEEVGTSGDVQAYEEEIDIEGRVQKIARSIRGAIGALKGTGIKIEVVTDIDEYESLADQYGADRESDGFFVTEDGTIFINIQRTAMSEDYGHIVWHEATHPLINILRNSSPRVYNEMVRSLDEMSRMNTPLGDDVRALFAWADQMNYPPERIDDEVMTEFISKVADGKINLDEIPTTFLDKVINFINELARMFGKAKLLDNTSSTQTMKKMAMDISDALQRGSGSRVEKIVGASNIGNYGYKDIIENQEPGTPIVGFIDNNKITQSHVSKKVINVYKNEKIKQDLPVRTMQEIYDAYGGKVLMINSDPTRVGNLKLPSGKEIFMYGGPHYLALKKNVDANVGFATTLMEKVEIFDRYSKELWGDKGVGVCVVGVSSPLSMFSNSYSLRYVMDAISMLPSNIVNSDKFKSELFGKNLVTFKSAFGENEYNILVKKYYSEDLTNPEIIDQFVQEISYKSSQLTGDNASAPFKARSSFVKNALVGFLDKAIPYVDVKTPQKYVSKILRDNLGLTQRKLMEEIGIPEFVKVFLDNNTHGLAISGFEIDNSKSFQDVQKNGIVHPLFNAKFRGQNPFLLDGIYEINKLLTPINQPQEDGSIYVKNAKSMLAISAYTKGDVQQSQDEKVFEFNRTVQPLIQSVSAPKANKTVQQSKRVNKNELKYLRNVSVLITPATVRNQDKRTEKIKKLSLKYDEFVKKFSSEPTEFNLSQINQVEKQILDAAKQEVVDKISKFKGVTVSFKDNNMGLWDGKFEPSFNMFIGIPSTVDSKGLSDVFFDFAEAYSQDAFILELNSELNSQIDTKSDGVPLSVYDDYGFMHYPQIVIKFPEPPTPKERADLGNNLMKNGITEFSLNDSEVKISVIKFFSEEEEELSKAEQDKIKKDDYDRKVAAAVNSWNVYGKSNGGVEIKIKKSKYNGAINEYSKQRTRQYDRGDIFKDIAKDLKGKEQLAAELSELRAKQIRLQKEGKKMSKEDMDKFVYLSKEILPIMTETFEAKKAKYEEAKREVERIAEEKAKAVSKNATVSKFPIKRPERASIKALRHYAADTEKLGDGARVNIIVNSDEEADKLFNSLVDSKSAEDKANPYLRSVNEITELGYPKRLVEVKASNGIISEMQVMTPAGYLAKDGVKFFDESIKDKAKTELSKIQDEIGFEIPDGIGHYFYELNRDYNVPENIRAEALRLSNEYYNAFLNPKSSELTEGEFRNDLNALMESVDNADKSTWDKGNSGKMPEEGKKFLGTEKKTIQQSKRVTPKLATAPDIIKRTEEASAKLKEIFDRDNLPLSTKEAEDIVKELIDWTDWYQGLKDYAEKVFGEYAEDVLSLMPLASRRNASGGTVSLAINNAENIYKGVKPKGLSEKKGEVTDFIQGKGIGSNKMRSFLQAITGDPNAIAVDMHVYGILRWKTKKKGELTQSPKNEAEFNRAKEFINTVAKNLGVEPRGVQAALWAANILRTGGKPDSYEKYIKQQVEAKGLTERVQSWRDKGYQPFSEVRKERGQQYGIQYSKRQKGQTPTEEQRIAIGYFMNMKAENPSSEEEANLLDIIDEAFLAGEMFGMRMSGKGEELQALMDKYSAEKLAALDKLLATQMNLKRDSLKKVNSVKSRLIGKIDRINFDAAEMNNSLEFIRNSLTLHFKENGLDLSQNRVAKIMKRLARIPSFKNKYEKLVDLIEDVDNIILGQVNSDTMSNTWAMIKKIKALSKAKHLTERDRNFIAGLNYTNPMRVLKAQGPVALQSYYNFIKLIHDSYSAKQMARQELIDGVDYIPVVKNVISDTLEMIEDAITRHEIQKKKNSIAYLVSKGELPSGTTVEEYDEYRKKGKIEDKDDDDPSVEEKQALIFEIQLKQSELQEALTDGRFGIYTDVAEELANVNVTNTTTQAPQGAGGRVSALGTDMKRSDLIRMNNILNNILNDGHFDDALDIVIKYADLREKASGLSRMRTLVRGLDRERVKKMGLGNIISNLFFNQNDRAKFFSVFYGDFNKKMNEVTKGVNQKAKAIADIYKKNNLHKKEDTRLFVYSFLNQYVSDREESFQIKLDKLIRDNVENLFETYSGETNLSLKRDMKDKAMSVAEALKSLGLIENYKVSSDNRSLIVVRKDGLTADSILGQLTADEQEAYDFALGSFSDIVDDVEKNARTVFGIDFVRQNNYFPMVAQTVSKPSNDLEFEPKIFGGKGGGVVKQPSDRIKKRMKLAGEGIYYQPGFADVFLNGYNDAFFTANAGREYRSMATLFNSTFFKDFLKGKFNFSASGTIGDNTLFESNENDMIFRNALKDMINQRIDDPFNYRKYQTKSARFMRYVSKMVTRTLLGRVTQIVNQYVPNVTATLVELNITSKHSLAAVGKAISLQTQAVMGNSGVSDAYEKFLSHTNSAGRVTMGNEAFEKKADEIARDRSSAEKLLDSAQTLTNTLGLQALRIADEGSNNVTIISSYIKYMIDKGKYNSANDFNIEQEAENPDAGALAYAELISARINNDSLRAHRAEVLKSNADAFWGHLWMLKGFNLNAWMEFRNSFDVLTSKYATVEDRKSALRHFGTYFSQILVFNMLRQFISNPFYEATIAKVAPLVFSTAAGAGDDEEGIMFGEMEKKLAKVGFSTLGDAFMGGMNSSQELAAKLAMNYGWNALQNMKKTPSGKIAPENKGTIWDPRYFRPFFVDDANLPGMIGLIMSMNKTVYAGLNYGDNAKYSESVQKEINMNELYKMFSYFLASGDLYRIFDAQIKRLKKTNKVQQSHPTKDAFKGGSFNSRIKGKGIFGKREK